MSRYIDADAMKEWLDEYLSVFKKYDKSEVKGFVEHQPSIDIVRCKECKHCSKDRIKWSVKGEDGNWIDTKCNLCRRTKLEVNLDDFCSYGERSSE